MAAIVIAKVNSKNEMKSTFWHFFSNSPMMTFSLVTPFAIRLFSFTLNLSHIIARFIV